MKRKVSQTREELLKNTVEYYNSENRGVNSKGNCSYANDLGKPCAIGREVSKKLAIELECNGNMVYRESVFELLPLRMQKMGQMFLGRIQRLHDESDNWTIEGLSERGVDKVNCIINEFKLDIPKY